MSKVLVVEVDGNKFDPDNYPRYSYQWVIKDVSCDLEDPDITIDDVVRELLEIFFKKHCKDIIINKVGYKHPIFTAFHNIHLYPKSSFQGTFKRYINKFTPRNSTLFGARLQIDHTPISIHIPNAQEELPLHMCYDVFVKLTVSVKECAEPRVIQAYVYWRKVRGKRVYYIQGIKYFREPCEQIEGAWRLEPMEDKDDWFHLKRVRL